MMALHGTMLGGPMTYEAGVQVMSTITPMVHGFGVVALLALAITALVAGATEPRDDVRHDSHA